MSHAALSFDELVCASVIESLDSDVPLGRTVAVARFGSDDIRGAAVDDVLFLPEIGVHVVAGRIVPLEAIQNPWRLEFERGRNFNGNADAYRSEFETTYRDEEVCILTNVYSRNFFHWISEELVKVAILERSGFTGRYVVLSSLPDFAMQFMALLGVSADRIIRRLDRPTVFRSVVYVTAIRGLTLGRCADTFFALREMLLTSVGADRPPSRRVWMDRKEGTHNLGRELHNPDEVYALLRRYGFEIVDMATLPVREQIAVAHGAAALSGLHGAAFIHAMFMHSRSSVIECFSPLFINPGWFDAIRLMRHRYFMIVYRNAHRGYPYGDRVMVDCSHLELTLQSLD